uniref:Uncharacterized protein n=1 Tax=Mustela putorius furo TaxID=9669 RepID=M3YN17_MUSPF
MLGLRRRVRPGEERNEVYGNPVELFPMFRITPCSGGEGGVRTAPCLLPRPCTELGSLTSGSPRGSSSARTSPASDLGRGRAASFLTCTVRAKMHLHQCRRRPPTAQCVRLFGIARDETETPRDPERRQPHPETLLKPGVTSLGSGCQLCSCRRPPRRGRGVCFKAGGQTAPEDAVARRSVSPLLLEYGLKPLALPGQPSAAARP